MPLSTLLATLLAAAATTAAGSSTGSAPPPPAPRATVGVVTTARTAVIGTRLELAIERHSGTVLVPSFAIKEALRQLGLSTVAGLTDSVVLNLARSTGADQLVVLEQRPRICRLSANRCDPVEASLPALTQLLELPASLGEEPGEAAMTAYATCRDRLADELSRQALKGASQPAASPVPACTMAAEQAPAFAPARSALAAARALTGGAWSSLAPLVREMGDDGLLAAIWIHGMMNDGSVRLATRQTTLAEAYALAPRSVLVPWSEAENLYRQDQFDAASDAFDRAVALLPGNAELLDRQSYTLHVRGRHAESLARAEQAAQRSGNQPEYLVALASRMIDVGRFGPAADLLEPLRARDPRWGRVLLRLGYAYLRMGRLADSIRLLEAVDKTEPRSPREASDKAIALLDLAQAQVRNQQPDKALATLDRLRRQHGLQEIELQDKDFDPLRPLPAFRKLLAPDETVAPAGGMSR